MAAIWFPHLVADWMLRRRPALKNALFVCALSQRGQRVVKAVNTLAQAKGIYPGMTVADCKAVVPDLQVFDHDPEQPDKLLRALGEWCIRFAPVVSVDLPDGLLIDASGCTHLWGDEKAYLKEINTRFTAFGYHIRIAMADTAGAARAVCRYGQNLSVVAPGRQTGVLSVLPSAALHLEATVLERLLKLGLKTTGSFMKMPRSALRRRFGAGLLKRLDQALGTEAEITVPIKPVAPYEERLPALDPIVTAKGIEIALKTLLEKLCHRLNRESRGMRKCELRCYRVDGTVQTTATGTNRPSRNNAHLFGLFELKIPQLRPEPGIELFILEASVIEELQSTQDELWAVSSAGTSAVAELLDRLAGKTGADAIQRYLPAEHHWPERSVKKAASLSEKPTSQWRSELPRPLHLLSRPEPVEVSVPIPDYPPLLFKYRGVLHTVTKADGPERIEQEWWIETGRYRDYYCVEDEHGARYWLFRSDDHHNSSPNWFIHGFFA